MSARELLSYLPENFRDSRETVVFQEALQPEIDGIWAARYDLLLQLNPYTATWGLDFWEAGLGIAPSWHLSLDLRRRQIVARLQGRGPTTPETVRSVAETFLGVLVAVIEVFDEYRVVLAAERGAVVDKDGMVRLKEQLIAILPAHLDFQVMITMAVFLAAAPRLGPRVTQTTLAPFQGSLSRTDLTVTAHGHGSISSMSLPRRAPALMRTCLPVGRQLGPRLSRTAPDGRMPSAAFGIMPCLGARISTTRLLHGAANHKGG